MQSPRSNQPNKLPSKLISLLGACYFIVLAAAVAWLIRETAFYGGNGAPPQLPDQGDDPQLPG